MSDIVKLHEDTLPSAIANGKILVEFTAEWCGPCKMLLPILEQLATEVKDKVTIAKIDVDQAQKAAAHYNITSIPTLILFDNGVEKSRTVGLKSLESLKSLIQ